MEHIYIVIDLKSFYASVECADRELDPLKTNLVVADASRTSKTICLAVSPSLKKYGLSGRSRLFQVEEKAREMKTRTGKPLKYITAPPRMQLYLDYSAKIYEIYKKYISPEDMHVYSIDEVFFDVTAYLTLYKMTAHQLAAAMVLDVFRSTGIPATAGIGTNLYLAKIALDIMAKRVDADENGLCIAELDESGYREQLWDHRPLTDFWRVGHGTASRLEKHGMYTMGDVARMSLHFEDLLYKEFGIDAELLIDHAWGVESCTMQDIKNYKPRTNCLSSGQVLPCPYSFDKGRLILQEMMDLMALDLVEKELVTGSITLHIGYDRETVDTGIYKGTVHIDHYGRAVPQPSHGTVRITDAGGTFIYSSSTKKLTDAAIGLYEQIVDKNLSIRRVNITFNDLKPADDQCTEFQQLSLFCDYTELESEKENEEREQRLQHAMLHIRHRYGKNAILKGMNLLDGATTIERNLQIGGHKA